MRHTKIQKLDQRAKFNGMQAVFIRSSLGAFAPSDSICRPQIMQFIGWALPTKWIRRVLYVY
jgi:hypothetical protein